MSWADGTPREYEELGGPPVESDEPEEPRHENGAVPATEVTDDRTICATCGDRIPCDCPKKGPRS